MIFQFSNFLSQTSVGDFQLPFQVISNTQRIHPVNLVLRLLCFLGFVRNQKDVFPNNSGKTLAILSGDQFREPMLLLKLKDLRG